MPAIAYCLWSQLQLLSVLGTLGCFVLGLMWWTLCEYYLHRFFFHAEDYWLPNFPPIFAFHFLLHGVHHAYPMDRMRLVFPPFPGYFVHFFFVITPMSWVFPSNMIYGAAAGEVFG